MCRNFNSIYAPITCSTQYDLFLVCIALFLILCYSQLISVDTICFCFVLHVVELKLIVEF